MVYYTRKNKLNKRKNRVTRGGAAIANISGEEMINVFISKFDSLTERKKKQYCDTKFAKNKYTIFYIIEKKAQITEDNKAAYLYILDFIKKDKKTPSLENEVNNFLKTLNKPKDKSVVKDQPHEETPREETPPQTASIADGQAPPSDTSTGDNGAASVVSGFFGTTPTTWTTGSKDKTPKDETTLQTTQPTSSPNIATTVNSTLIQLSEQRTMEQLKALIAKIQLGGTPGSPLPPPGSGSPLPPPGPSGSKSL